MWTRAAATRDVQPSERRTEHEPELMERRATMATTKNTGVRFMACLPILPSYIQTSGAHEH
jgi:hypothetical protein